MKCICPMPCNLYGTNDNFDKNNSHVLAALVRRFVDAVEESKDCEMLWGTGEAMREFLHVDDAADAFYYLRNGIQVSCQCRFRERYIN